MFDLKTFNTCAASLALLAAGILVGWSQTSMKSPDVTASIRTSLDQAGLKDVSVTQDREKGVVTLNGNVAADGDKTQAQSIAASLAGRQVLANQIAVIARGAEHEAKTMNADLDKGIGLNLDAALIANQLHESVKYDVKNHVVTLTGEVDSQTKRRQAASVASSVPNVWQVVNELQIKNQKASSTE
jgi:hyperosmotically inducible protein